MRAGAIAMLLCCTGLVRADIVSLRAFTDSQTPQSRECLRYTGLVQRAYDLLKQGNDREAAANKLVETYAEKVSGAAQQEQIRRAMAGAALVASSLLELGRDNASFAYLEMCRQRALGLWPATKDAQAQAFRVALADARRCEKTVAPGRAQSNCVVLAFEPR
jgi:hypothetical protein